MTHEMSESEESRGLSLRGTLAKIGDLVQSQSHHQAVEIGELVLAAFTSAPIEVDNGLHTRQVLSQMCEGLRKALEWYAEPVLTYAITQNAEPRSAVHADGGRRARAVLASRPANDGPNCDTCREPHWYNFFVPDDVWKQIAPLNVPGGGALCVRCIDKRCAELGIKTTGRFHFTGEAVTSFADREDRGEPVAMMETIESVIAEWWSSEEQLETHVLAERIANTITYPAKQPVAFKCGICGGGDVMCAKCPTESEPDEFCITQPDGSCISEDTRCMHQVGPKGAREVLGKLRELERMLMDYEKLVSRSKAQALIVEVIAALASQEDPR